MAKYCPYCASQINNGKKCTVCNFNETYSAQSHHLQPGTLLHGRYLIGVVLGEGGFGITYLGRDLALDMKVAVKEYYPSGIAARSPATTCNVTILGQTFLQDFQAGKKRVIEEAQALAKLDKESAVVTVRDFFEENNSAYIVMEFVEGSDLRKEIQRQQKPMEHKNLLPLLEPVFEALDELHSHGLVHRDISPDNIMIENNVARLIDFGCAMPTRHDGQHTNTVKHGFSPLEQYNNENIGPWTDVYAMAATIYYCITGKLPPKATDRAVADTIQTPSSLGIKINAKQEKALMRALSINPQDRFQSMAEFGKALFIHRNKSKVITIAACLIAILSVILWVAIPRGTSVTTLEVERVPKTVYTQADDIPAEEAKKLELLTEILKENTVIEQEDYYYYVNTKNITDYTYENLYIYVQLLSEDNTLLGSSTLLIKEWEKGRNFRDYVYCNDDPAVIQLKMSFDVGDNRYETDYNDVSFSTSSKYAITINNTLPQELSYTNYSNQKSTFVITAIDFKISYSSVYIHVDGEKISGETENYEYLDYRITSGSGAVVQTGTLSIPRLASGEKFENATVSLFSLEPGAYQFELSDKVSK